MLKDPAAILVDIIRTYMGLTTEQVWQFDAQKIKPNDLSLFVVVHFLAEKPYATNSLFEVDNTDPENPIGIETTFTQTKEFYRIEIASADRAAQSRRHEITNALASGYSQTKQREYNFRIFPVSDGSINASRLDGGSMLNRFMVKVELMACYESTRQVEFYDTFPFALTPNS